MPEAGKFLNSFHLIEGKRFGSYTLTKIRAIHYVIVMYREYKYKITLYFNGNGNVNNLIDNINEVISEEHNVLATRNYYHCSIDKLTDRNVKILKDGTVMVSLIGHATR